jgi:hypothetical protein
MLRGSLQVAHFGSLKLLSVRIQCSNQGFHFLVPTQLSEPALGIT